MKISHVQILINVIEELLVYRRCLRILNLEIFYSNCFLLKLGKFLNTCFGANERKVLRI